MIVNMLLVVRQSMLHKNLHTEDCLQEALSLHKASISVGSRDGVLPHALLYLIRMYTTTFKTSKLPISPSKLANGLAQGWQSIHSD